MNKPIAACTVPGGVTANAALTVSVLLVSVTL